MKNDDIELLREVQRNAEMGMHALEVINPKVYDDSMALMLARESFKYGELHDRARAMLLSKNQPLSTSSYSSCGVEPVMSMAFSLLPVYLK